MRPSTRVSPGFSLPKCRSPSFGSKGTSSGSSARCEVDAKGRDCAVAGSSLSCENSLCFHCAFEVNELNDLDVSLTPWSVFQDGSEAPPTYSQQRCGPCKRNSTRYTRPLCYPPPVKLGTESFQTSRKLLPWPQSTDSGSLRECEEKCSQCMTKLPSRVLSDQQQSR